MYFFARFAFVFVFTLIGTAWGQTSQSEWSPKTDLNESSVDLTRVAVAELSPDGTTVYAYQPLYKQAFSPARHTEYFQSSSGKVIGSNLLIDEWRGTPVAFRKYEISLGTDSFFDLEGNSINQTKLKELLAKPISVLISNSPKPEAIDGYYKSIFAKDLIQISVMQKADDGSVIPAPSTIQGLQAWAVPSITLPKELTRIHVKNVSVAKMSKVSDKLTLDLMVPQYIHRQMVVTYDAAVESVVTEEVVGPEGKIVIQEKKVLQMLTETKNSFLLEPRAFARFALPAEAVQFKSVAGEKLALEDVASRLKKPTHLVFFDGDKGWPFLEPFYAAVFAKECIVVEVPEPWRYIGGLKEIARPKQ